MTEHTASDVRRLAALVPGGDAGIEIEISDQPPSGATSAFDVDRLLGSTASFAAAELAALDGSLVTQRSIDLRHLLAWSTSTVAVDGRPIPAWADLSGVYETGDDRHLQLHCNFSHHAAGVLEHLGVPNDRAALAAAIRERTGEVLETELIERGMIAALVRTMDEWDRHAHALATSRSPLVSIERIGDGPAGSQPSAAEVRVLDCTRVLAGPVAGHLLASAGADVLRVGAAHLPSVEVGVLSTGFGKRNAHLDLRTPDDRATMDELLATTDVWIDAYRPGALASLGVTAERAAAQRPGIVVVEIDAFGSERDTTGPWAGRRGFDSIVQSTTGIRWAGGVHAVDAAGEPLDPTPRGLPVQALDHATGFLAAGVAARLLRHQREAGGSWLARLSLLRTRDLVVGFGGPRPYEPTAASVDHDLLDAITAPVGEVSAVRPFAGRWTGPPMPLGSAPPSWRDR